ncbi:leucine Rich Repeat [Seminavis robusta]|uniref:Leucine Rich Repeat n=1 Tax=Seminavis robusta TaxID=568900 RepID=A0A9N8E8B7_9STRA|nr:leucine Rich Repeat [Seminavis robusta]|eukprot:Sro659_g182840.1 leucine Rich Repeat (474) ;mRNA; r:5047-6468
MTEEFGHGSLLFRKAVVVGIMMSPAGDDVVTDETTHTTTTSPQEEGIMVEVNAAAAPRRLVISDYYKPDESWMDVFENLPILLSPSIQEIIVDRRDFIESLSEDQLMQVMIWISRLPFLERLSLSFVQQPGEPLPLTMTALSTVLLHRQQPLQYLEVAWVCLQGTEPEWHELLHVLSTRYSLKEVKFRNLCLNPDHQQPQSSISASSQEESVSVFEPQLHDLLHVLAHLPSLEEVFVLDAHRIIHDWRMPDPNTALPQLASSTSLQTLCLMIPLSRPQVQQLARTMTTCHHFLERLALFRCQVNDEGCGQLAHMLHYNTRLQILRLDDNRISTRGCVALANALRVNTTLRILDLKGNAGIERAGYQALCDTLEFDNFGLMGLEMEPPQQQQDNDDDDDIMVATARSETNTCSSTGQIQDKIRLFLKLNEQARRVFLRHVNHRALFVDCLHHFREEPDFLFYYLQANPVVCQVD